MIINAKNTQFVNNLGVLMNDKLSTYIGVKPLQKYRNHIFWSNKHNLIVDLTKPFKKITINKFLFHIQTAQHSFIFVSNFTIWISLVSHTLYNFPR